MRRIERAARRPALSCNRSLALLVLVATLGLARWSFERGFYEYVNALRDGRRSKAA